MDYKKPEFYKGKERMTNTDIAAMCGVSEASIRRWRSRASQTSPMSNTSKQIISPDVKELEEQLQTERSRNDLVQFLEEKSYQPIKITKSQSSHNRAAFLVASDWHIEERVDSDKIHGLNSFDLKTARERAKNFFANGVDLATKYEAADTIFLCLNGDFISGYIHEELMEGNEVSPPRAVWECSNMIISGIQHILDNSDAQIYVPCCVGNHGRTTKKRTVATAVENSYEWLMYKWIEKFFEGNPRVTFNIASGKVLYYDVFGMTIRQTHGDQIRGGNGVGGVAVPIMRKIMKWDKARSAEVTILGHFHQLINYRELVVNGSLIGYNQFAEEIGASPEKPAQAFFVIDAEYGKTVSAPIFL